MAAQAQTFHLFTSLPTELQVMILNQAAAPSTLSDESTRPSWFLFDKIDELIGQSFPFYYIEDDEEGCLDPLGPLMELLRPPSYDSAVLDAAIRTRNALLHTSQLCRRVALETWEQDVAKLEDRDGRTVGAGDLGWAKRKFAEILKTLLEDVRRTLVGQNSELEKLWKAQEQCKQRRRRRAKMLLAAQPRNMWDEESDEDWE